MPTARRSGLPSPHNQAAPSSKALAGCRDAATTSPGSWGALLDGSKVEWVVRFGLVPVRHR